MTKLSPHQIFMLRMFEKGWGFKMFNSKRGSWMTYWSLRTRGLIGNGPTIHRAGNLVAVDRLTDKGREALRKYDLQQETRQAQAPKRNRS
jgi:hypothetical protein